MTDLTERRERERAQEEAWRDLAEVAYGSRDAVWTSHRTLVARALDKARGCEVPKAIHIKGAFIASAQTPVILADDADKSSIEDCDVYGFDLPMRGGRSWLSNFHRPRLRRFAAWAIRVEAVRRFARWAAYQPTETNQTFLQGPRE